MRKKGRPKGGDSAATKKKILGAARVEFAANGYDGAAIVAIAKSVGIAPSAVYHYFQSKEKLYTEVFKQTSVAIWDSVSPTDNPPTLVEAMEQLLDNSRLLADKLPSYSDFLASLPIEAKLHPQFSELLKQRADYQDKTFRNLALIGIASGELHFLSEDEATELIRSIIMGWFFERHFRQEEIEHSGEAIISMFKHLYVTNPEQ
tara:strand:+ start:3890 stop:4501 length:612 start_codon:yes stop_codon:yes gene_type:complete